MHGFVLHHPAQGSRSGRVAWSLQQPRKTLQHRTPPRLRAALQQHQDVEKQNVGVLQPSQLLQAADVVAAASFEEKSGSPLEYATYKMRVATLMLVRGANPTLRHATFGAVLDNHVVGVSEVTIQSLPRHLAGPCSLPYNCTVAIISNMAVKQTYRRQGIGRRLLEQCCAFAAHGGDDGDTSTTTSHIRAVLLYVRKYNDAALQLYECSGFELVEWTDPAWLESAYRGEAAGSRKLLMMAKL